MMRLVGLCGVVLVMTAGCDSGGSAASDSAGSANQWSCDVGTGAGRTCTDNTYPDSLAQAVTMAKAQCTASSGTIGTTCDTTGAAGGCRLTDAGGIAGNTTTQWFFSGTMAQIMANCQPGAVFVAAP